MRSISQTITPNSVGCVNTVRCDFYALLAGVDLKHTRIDRLKQFASSRGVSDNPAMLGKLIGKQPNQVYNLLHGTASFGEKVARSIEESAGLPRYWLDKDPDNQTGLTPEVVAMANQIDALPPRQREWVMKTLRDTIDLARETIPVKADAVAHTTVPASVAERPSSKRRKAA